MDWNQSVEKSSKSNVRGVQQTDDIEANEAVRRTSTRFTGLLGRHTRGHTRGPSLSTADRMLSPVLVRTYEAVGAAMHLDQTATPLPTPTTGPTTLRTLLV